MEADFASRTQGVKLRRLVRDKTMSDQTPEMRQLAAGFMEVALCLAKALHEADPTVAQKMNFAAGLAYNRLMSEGNGIAADVVYTFGRSLLNRDHFPFVDEPADLDAGG